MEMILIYMHLFLSQTRKMCKKMGKANREKRKKVDLFLSLTCKSFIKKSGKQIVKKGRRMKMDSEFVAADGREKETRVDDWIGLGPMT